MDQLRDDQLKGNQLRGRRSKIELKEQIKARVSRNRKDSDLNSLEQISSGSIGSEQVILDEQSSLNMSLCKD
ncbi:hypothetical protein F511_21794 [Dorcoceras hygrometricum]|uniref:Uncharacterized protein n=1 Tax=Dorcoceras hygrometricum TaxID=472368 RepID=A0A2Z7BMR0_9LAMI|nr:hypothetical protein F511_21794 [Dorcoceras hygrometricum]